MKVSSGLQEEIVLKLMEKWFDTMKKRFKRHPNEGLQEFVKWYSEERVHQSLDYKTPEEVYFEKL